MLNASARNCMFHLSLIFIFLKKEVSTLTRPGPRSAPRDTFPNVPTVGIVKASGSSQLSRVPTITDPLNPRFQLGTAVTLVSRVPELLKPIAGVKGKPAIG